MRRKNIIYLVMSLILVVVFTSSVSGNEFHRHHLALSVGNTQEGFGEHGLSIAADYEYRFSRLFGLGGMVEYAGGDFEHWLGFVTMFFHPAEHWEIILAPGTEIEKGTRDRDFIFRTGVAYLFHLGAKYSIAPEFFVDFSENETLFVYGLSFGIGF